jgi:ribosomal protein S18 acetylase RimI-like enzyme
MDSQNLKIRPVKIEEIDMFFRLLSEAFSDKFPFFYKGIPKEQWVEITKQLQLLAYPDDPLHGLFIAESIEDGSESGSQLVGVIRTLDADKPKEHEWPALKYLIKKLGFFKGFRTGVLLYIFGTKPIDKDELYIDAIGVAQEFRSKGVGSALIKKMEELARQKGRKRLTLYVSSKNVRAKQLYEKLGFVETYLRKSKMTKRNLDIDGFYFMVKPLI